MRIEIEAVETAYEPGVEEPRGHVCEPRLLRLRDRAVLLSHRTGTRRESCDGSPALLRSRDGGATWQRLGLPFERERPHGWDFRRASLTELRSGGVLAGVLAIDKSSGRPVHNPETEGALPIHARFARSEDEAETWSDTWELGDVGVSQLAAEQLLTLTDGELLCTYERFKEYDDRAPWRYEGGVIRSRDDGATWRGATVVAASDYEHDPDDTMWWDPRTARLTDGRLFQCTHAYRHRSGSEGPLHVAWSGDDGRTWTPPAPTQLRGQVGYPVALAGGGVVVLQQRRFEPQTIVAVLSPDGGRTYEEEETVVYRHDGASAPAADGSLDPLAYLASMDRFTFGHPTGIELEPEVLLAAWYAGGVERTSILTARLRVHRR